MTAFVKYGQFLIFILQVYAPSYNHPVQVYRKFTDHLRAIISMYCHNGLVVVLGDFNVHLQGEQYKPTDDSRSHLLDLMNYHNPVGLNTLPLLFKKFLSEQFIASVEVSNIARCSS